MKPSIMFTVSSCAIAAVLCLIPRSNGADEPKRDTANLVGHKACGICHKKDDNGNQLGKWQESPHSKAYEVLGTPKAKEVAAKLGIENPQNSAQCLTCHSTAYHWTDKIQTAKLKPEDGVSCESCHGPGKKYMPKSVMEDRNKCIEKGMIYPATESCAKCHNDKNPTYNPERYTTKDGKKVDFDVEQAYEKIKHPDPKVKR